MDLPARSFDQARPGVAPHCRIETAYWIVDLPWRGSALSESFYLCFVYFLLVILSLAVSSAISQLRNKFDGHFATSLEYVISLIRWSPFI